MEWKINRERIPVTERILDETQEQGVELTHPLEQYCQGNGYLVYGSPAARHGAKLTRLQGEHMAAGLHPGIVDSDLWLSVQERLAARGGCTNRGTGHRSWLQGLAVRRTLLRPK